MNKVMIILMATMIVGADLTLQIVHAHAWQPGVTSIDSLIVPAA